MIDPPPDLAVEVDITSSSLNRLRIYAALKVPEIWHFDGQAFKVLLLGANGKYRKSAKSLAFPNLPTAGFARFVKKLGTKDEIRLMEEFHDWLQKDVQPKQSKSE